MCGGLLAWSACALRVAGGRALVLGPHGAAVVPRLKRPITALLYQFYFAGQKNCRPIPLVSGHFRAKRPFPAWPPLQVGRAKITGPIMDITDILGEFLGVPSFFPLETEAVFFRVSRLLDAEDLGGDGEIHFLVRAGFFSADQAQMGLDNFPKR